MKGPTTFCTTKFKMHSLFRFIVKSNSLQCIETSHLMKTKLFENCTMRTNLPKTLDQLIFGKYTLNLSKFTKYLVNVLKFTKYLVNSYHQKDVKHYVLTN